jgi:hypothetical protein
VGIIVEIVDVSEDTGAAATGESPDVGDDGIDGGGDSGHDDELALFEDDMMSRGMPQ